MFKKLKSLILLLFQFSVFIANEFLDALPIHQFQKDDVGQWHEIYIALNENDQLYFMLSKGENLYTKLILLLMHFLFILFIFLFLEVLRCSKLFKFIFILEV